MGSPWFKMYAKDLLADKKVRLLTDDQVGKLVKLWCFCCQDGSIPADLDAVGILLGLDPSKTPSKSLQWVVEFFPKNCRNHAERFSPRMKREHQKYEQKCEKLRLNASKGGKKKAENRLANALPNALANALANGLANSSEPETEKIILSGTVSQRQKKAPSKQTLKEMVESLNIQEYWSLHSLWPKEANQQPKRAVQILATLKNHGAAIPPIVDKAGQLIAQTKGRVTRLDTWLEQGGWEDAAGEEKTKSPETWITRPYSLGD